jgi:hemin uptake protein HemP
MARLTLKCESLSSSHPPGNRSQPCHSRLLLRESRELVIEHLGQEYRLRRTRNDKLILTK